jgi:hypothetical protein
MSANPSKPYSPRGQGAKNRMSATPPALIPAVRGGAHPILGHGRSERQSMPEGCRSSQTSPIHGMPTNARHAPKHRQTLSSPKHTILFLSTRCLGLGLPGSTLGAVLSELYSRSCTLRRLHGSITLRRQHHMHLLQQARLVASPTITPPACRPPPAGQHEGVCHAQTDSCMSTPPAPATCHESCQSPKSCLSPPPAPATSTRPPVSLSPHPLTPLSLSLRIQPAPAPEPAREQVGGGCERERPSARERGRALCVCVFRCVFQ